MKFDEIKYTRPSVEKFEANFVALRTKFEKASTWEEQDNALLEFNRLFDDFYTMYELAHIRLDLNTKDEFLEKEADFFSDCFGLMAQFINQYFEVLNEAKFKDALIKKRGKHLFNIAAYKVKGFDPAIVEELKKESHLGTEYTKIIAGAEIAFEGETLNLPGIDKYLSSSDRATREKAHKVYWDFFAGQQEKLDDLFDRNVKLRHSMAVKLGYENFIDVGYIRMQRIDYDKNMVANFRQQVVDEIVPIVSQLRERQRKRLGYEKLMDYDLRFHFTSGNPTPKGTPQEIIGQAKKMYGELSDETDEFFSHLLKYNLIDYLNKPGKADKGYCWELSNYRHPFIFANFNGTSGDIDVLTHEAGHAFQYFKSGANPIVHYRSPSQESAEIHSMSMEFLTYPWMKGFFKEDTSKYYYAHLTKSLLFLPFGCAGDHFQQTIYENPKMSPNERAAVWNDLAKLYMPDNKYNSTPYLKDGRYWQRIQHLFNMPFYFIDYVLAQICAFQFWQKAGEDRATAWKDYVRLCEAGGTTSFLELLKIGNLKSPFEPGVVKQTTSKIIGFLDAIDDSKF